MQSKSKSNSHCKVLGVLLLFLFILPTARADLRISPRAVNLTLQSGQTEDPLLIRNSSDVLFGVYKNGTTTISGNVGIGTASPLERLHINGSIRADDTSGSPIFYVNSTSGRLGIGKVNPTTALDILGDLNVSNSFRLYNDLFLGRLGFDNSIVLSSAAANNGSSITLQKEAGGRIPVKIYGNLTIGDGEGSSIFYADSKTANKVGIGTTSPYDLLHLDNGKPSKLRISNFGQSANNSVQIYNIAHNLEDNSVSGNNLSAGGSLFIGISENGVTGSSADIWNGTHHLGAAYMAAHGYSNSSGYHGNLRFYTKNAGTTSERMIITSTGKVGIGTSNPQASLSIGDLGSGLNESTYVGTQQLAYPGGSLNQNGGLEFKLSTSSFGHGWRIFPVDLFSGNTPFVIQYRSGSPNWVEAMRITNSGNVGIGTTNPQSLLQIGSPNQYMQISFNSTPLPSADCDSSLEIGRMTLDNTTNRLFVCTGASGWKSTALT